MAASSFTTFTPKPTRLCFADQSIGSECFRSVSFPSRFHSLKNWRKMKEGKGDRYFVNPRAQNFEVINSRFPLVFNSTTEL
ncbi:hypothetical protein CK203_066897 [Vitis vinifera]|uniref:Uncharacterized protein n=1 Tax=Vitis vinifera TaxID=29760 RepID=A0A438F5L7_VITVI|nr:hypothetical protein CK203_066897 [Vitis vinifera]